MMKLAKIPKKSTDEVINIAMPIAAKQTAKKFKLTAEKMNEIMREAASKKWHDA